MFSPLRWYYKDNSLSNENYFHQIYQLIIVSVASTPNLRLKLMMDEGPLALTLARYGITQKNITTRGSNLLVRDEVSSTEPTLDSNYLQPSHFPFPFPFPPHRRTKHLKVIAKMPPRLKDSLFF